MGHENGSTGRTPARTQGLCLQCGVLARWRLARLWVARQELESVGSQADQAGGGACTAGAPVTDGIGCAATDTGRPQGGFRVVASWFSLMFRRTMYSRSALRPMAHGSCLGPRTVVYSFGSQTVRRSSCCRGIRIQASRFLLELFHPSLTSRHQSSLSTWPRAEICLQAAVVTVMLEFGNIRMYSEGCIITDAMRSMLSHTLLVYGRSISVISCMALAWSC